MSVAESMVESVAVSEVKSVTVSVMVSVTVSVAQVCRCGAGKHTQTRRGGCRSRRGSEVGTRKQTGVSKTSKVMIYLSVISQVVQRAVKPP